MVILDCGVGNNVSGLPAGVVMMVTLLPAQHSPLTIEICARIEHSGRTSAVGHMGGLKVSDVREQI